MKKNNKYGFMLVETLIVTIFVSGVLIFLFIQFSSLSKSYEESFNYNTIEGIYALEDIKDYINKDETLKNYISNNIDNEIYIDITDCSKFENNQYCLKLFELLNIDKVFITKNSVESDKITGYGDDFNTFIKKINSAGNQKYRLIASFNDSTYSTLRFGD